MLIAAHPDDETIGAGALISRNTNVKVLHVTDGVPPGMADAACAGFASREAYASARTAEARLALSLAGIQPSAIYNMRFTDQRVAFSIAEVSIRILETLERELPDIILTHAYEGGHHDHDSVAVACHMAHKIYRRNHRRPVPRLMEFAGYHGEGGSLKTNEFLPGTSQQEIQHHLTSKETNQKTQMLATFRTQAKTLQAFLPPRVERYREAPKYDFGRPPHAGKPFYEHFDWGMDGATWRELTQNAVSELSLAGRKSCTGSRF